MAPLLACGALVMILGAQFLIPPDAPPPDMAGLAPRRIRPIGPPAEPDFPAILASPIFSPDRRPGGSGATADLAAGDGETLTGYAALGAVTGRGVATGVVSVPGGGVKTLHRGEEVAGWRLVGVDNTRLIFGRDGARVTLTVGGGPLVPAADGPSISPIAGGPRQ